MLNSILAFLRVILAWVFTGFMWIPLLFIYLVSFRLIPDSILSKMIRFWGRTLLKLLSVQLEFVNTSTLEDQRPRVIIVNHQSALDLLWTAAIVPPSVSAIGKKEIIFVPIINVVWWAFDFIRIDRSNTRKAIQSLQGVAENLSTRKKSLLVAPEGTRTYTGEILPFKKGAFHIAFTGNIPIYPVVVSGAFELLPRTRFLPKPGVIRVQFLAPVETKGLKIDDMPPLIDKVRNQMIAALNELNSRNAGEPS